MIWLIIYWLVAALVVVHCLRQPDENYPNGIDVTLGDCFAIFFVGGIMLPMFFLDRLYRLGNVVVLKGKRK